LKGIGFHDRDHAYAASIVSDIATQVAKLRALKSLSRLDVKRATIEEAMDEVQVIIDEAKLDRDQGPDGIRQAIAQLKSAVKLLDGVGWSAGIGARALASGEQKKAAAQMADCLGMIGGNCRRLGHTRGALTWFKKGRKIEQDERFNIDSTYNLGNEISTSIELGNRTASPTMKASLRKALVAMKRRTEGSRHRDRWAWADQGQCCLLLGDYDGAQRAYQRFLELGDRKSTLISVVPVLTKLHDALVSLQDPTAETLRRGIEYLEREAMKQI
jgi:tetratricopeptide (TPR) repeat protein